jgi:hypothetical protein
MIKPKYKVGDMVYRILDKPKNALNRYQDTTDKFRAGDYYLDLTIRKIVQILYMNDKPLHRYLLSDLKSASFTENQLRKLSDTATVKINNNKFQTENDEDNIYLVESVLSHKPKVLTTKNINRAKFEVKWIEFEKTLFEPWKNAKMNVALHDYLRDHNMSNLILSLILLMCLICMMLKQLIRIYI